jgi:peroxiredoxin
MPAAGDAAPDFELPDSTGNSRRLRELFSQRSLVLVFYRGDW